METKAITRRIEQIQKKAGLNQADLAAHLGVTQPAIHHYLQGRIPPAEVLLRLARLQETTIEWILTGYEPAPDLIREPGSVYQTDDLAGLCEKLKKLGPEQRRTLEDFIDSLISV